MSAPRINPALLSAETRANLERVQGQMPLDFSAGNCDNGAKHRPIDKKGHKKKTLTPDMAHDLVKCLKVSEDGNQVKIVLGIDVNGLPTAQQKGAFVGKDGRVHFFTKSKIAKAEKALIDALSPYAHYSGSWGDVPIECALEFFFPFPSGTPRKKLHKIAPHINRPDADNLAKLPLDCLTQAGYWKDDSLLCNFSSKKRRTTQSPCMVIRITNLQPKFEELYKDTEEHDSPSLFKGNNKVVPEETNPLSEMSLSSTATQSQL